MKQPFLALSSFLLCITYSVEANPGFSHRYKWWCRLYKASMQSSVLDGKYGFGYQAGIMTGMDTGSLYVQGEALFNKRKTSYEFRRKLFYS